MANNLKSTNRNVVYLVILLVVAAVAWSILTLPDQRTGGQKIGDAIDALPQGVDKAAKELEDRSPGEKLGDAVKDVGDDIKESTDR